MDVVLDAGGLEVFHAGGGTGYDEHGAAIEILEGGDGILGILIVAGADHHDISLSLQSSINTLLDRLEAEVVDDLVSGACQEVAGELCACLTHGEVAYGEHEGYGHLGGLLSGEAQGLEVGSQTRGLQFLEWSLLITATGRSHC